MVVFFDSVFLSRPRVIPDSAAFIAEDDEADKDFPAAGGAAGVSGIALATEDDLFDGNEEDGAPLEEEEMGAF